MLRWVKAYLSCHCNISKHRKITTVSSSSQLEAIPKMPTNKRMTTKNHLESSEMNIFSEMRIVTCFLLIFIFPCHSSDHFSVIKGGWYICGLGSPSFIRRNFAQIHLGKCLNTLFLLIFRVLRLSRWNSL